MKRVDDVCEEHERSEESVRDTKQEPKIVRALPNLFQVCFALVLMFLSAATGNCKAGRKGGAHARFSQVLPFM